MKVTVPLPIASSYAFFPTQILMGVVKRLYNWRKDCLLKATLALAPESMNHSSLSL
jgi:hypothetical protein